MMILTVVSAFFLLFLQGVVCQVFQPPELSQVVGQSVQLSCMQNATTHYTMYWYKQPQGGALEFLGSGYEGSKEVGKFTLKVISSEKSTSLSAEKVEMSDAATYFCAVENRNNYAFTFGSGMKLEIHPDIRNSEPSVYVLQPPKGKASEVNPLCLVTDFSPANETKVVVNEIPQNNSPTLVKTDGQWSYGIVAWSSADECKAKYFNEFYSSEKPKDGAQDVCSTGMISEHFETDEKLNSLSLTVLGLRIIFAKTVVINVLMTLRLWRS